MATHNKTANDWGKTPWSVAFRPKPGTLPEKADFVIVGGGFAGLSAAAQLRRMAPRKSVLVLEAGAAGNGSSGRTGGMALEETAAGKLPGLGNVVAGYKQILRTLGVKAEASFPGVWEIGRGGTAAALDSQAKRLKFRKNSAIHWKDSGDLRIVRKVPGGCVDPGKVVAGLARAAERAGAQIVENAEVVRAELGNSPRLHVRLIRRGKRHEKLIHAGQVLFATNAGGLEISGMPRRAQAKLTFAIATGPMKAWQVRALGLADRRPFYTVDLPYLWGRIFGKKRIIFGSGLVPAFGETIPSGSEGKRNLWGGLEKVSVRSGEADSRLRALEERVRGLHPLLKNVKITHRWGGPILITEDWRPVFRRHPKSKQAIVLGGFSGHGVALSVYLGRWAAQVLLKQKRLPRWS
jgi:glycine/D-amino acid oxidase-like deaminating enzyme